MKKKKKVREVDGGLAAVRGKGGVGLAMFVWKSSLSKAEIREGKAKQFAYERTRHKKGRKEKKRQRRASL